VTVAPNGRLRHHAAHRLAQVTDTLRQSDVPFESRVVEGHPAEGILAAAGAEPVDLIAMATHSWSDMDRWLNGSVADAVLQHARLPVLLVTADCRPHWPADQPARVLVPLDGSRPSEAVLPAASEVAGLLGADRLLLKAVGPAQDSAQARREARRYLEGLAARLRGPEGPPVEAIVAAGEPAVVIEAAAGQDQVSLIALATHGRGGLGRVLAGSIATATLRQAQVPLLLVRPREADSSW
jgi:nucleotide-binding universal stress UspA family protein